MKNLIISGPTASGKSDIALHLASVFGNMEIINADAFQVYKGLDIGTAKPSLEIRRQIPHHLIDILEPDVCYTAGQFVQQGEKLLGEIRKKNHIPIIVGGTGLYIKSLAEGIFNCPDIDPGIRVNLNRRLKDEGLLSLYRELYNIDQKYALQISQNDPVRVIRALEVCIGLKMPFSEAHQRYKKKPLYNYKILVLAPDRKLLYNDINERTKLMWNCGWVDEVKSLLHQGYNENCPSFRAIGYREIAAYIKNGGNSEKVIEEIAKQTRHFAKRQFTWFRGMNGIDFFSSKSELVNEAKLICSSWSS